MTDDKNNKDIKQPIKNKIKQKDVRRPLPKANIIDKRLEIFNIGLNTIYKGKK